MAHYAVLDEDNVVLEVLTGMDEDDTDNLPEGYEDWESWYSSLRDGKTVVRTSYNTRDGVHALEERSMQVRDKMQVHARQKRIIVTMSL